MVQISARLRRDLKMDRSSTSSSSGAAAVNEVSSLSSSSSATAESDECLSWKQLEGRCRLVNMLHDELIYEVRREDLAAVAAIVREEMENALPLKVGLRVQLKSGLRWGSLELL